jgi:hypothetical protein
MQSGGHPRDEREQHVYAVLQQYGGYVLAGVWMVGIILMYLRFRAYQRAYLQKCPPVNGVPLDMAVGGNPFGEVARAVNSAMNVPQPDPDLEHMRLQMWRRYRHVALWVFGMPLLAVGVAALVLTVFPH